MELIGIIINVCGFLYMYYKLQQLKEEINSITKAQEETEEKIIKAVRESVTWICNCTAGIAKELRPRKKAEIEERKRDAREQTADFLKAQNIKSDIYY